MMAMVIMMVVVMIMMMIMMMVVVVMMVVRMIIMVMMMMVMMIMMMMDCFCLFVGCLTFQQHASVSQGRICTDNFMCCHTEIEVTVYRYWLNQSQC